MTGEIGLGKTAQRGYHLDDIAIVPSRRTRDVDDVSTEWKLDAYPFKIPCVAHPSDATMSPQSAVALGMAIAPLMSLLVVPWFFARRDPPADPGAVKEFGYAEIRARGHSRLLQDIEDRVNAEGHGLLDVWMSHGDHVSALPAGFKLIASTKDVPIAGMADEARGYYGVQFHPEVTHTPHGVEILQNFLYEVCKCSGSWRMARPRTCL